MKLLPEYCDTSVEKIPDNRVEVLPIDDVIFYGFPHIIIDAPIDDHVIVDTPIVQKLVADKVQKQMDEHALTTILKGRKE